MHILIDIHSIPKVRRPINIRCPSCGARRGLKVSPSDNKDGVVYYCHACGISTGSWRDKRDIIPKVVLSRPVNDTLAPYWQDKWGGAKRITPDDPAGQYLTGRRCRIPGRHVARYVSSLKHSETGLTFPGMLVLMTDIRTNEPINLLRYFLTEYGKKAEVSNPKKTLAGHRTNGAYKISADTEVEVGLFIGEGFETCLSLPYRPVWSLGNANNLSGFPVLDGIEALTILVDNDENGIGQNKADAVADRWYNAGKEVSLITPQGYGDINDVIREKVLDTLEPTTDMLTRNHANDAHTQHSGVSYGQERKHV